MSSTPAPWQRLLSGSTAAVARVGVVFLMQVGLVPLYLQHWSATQFGYWMFLQSAIVIITVPDAGLQAYVEVAYIRRSGRSSRRLSMFLSMGASTGLMLSVLQLLMCGVLHYSGALHWMLHPPASEAQWVDQIGAALMVTALSWPLASSVAGSMGRASVVQGSVAPQIWWSILTLLCGSAASAWCASLGGDLLQAAQASAVATAFSGLSSILYFRARFRRQGVSLMLLPRLVRMAVVKQAAGLMLKLLFETIRQHSLRLIAPQVVAVAAMASLSVHRTLVGAMQQAFGVISAPLLPEYVRAQGKDEFSAESARLMRLQWRFFTGVVLPGGLLLLVLGPRLFEVWTHGKIVFDSVVFSILLLAVASFALFAPFTQYLQAANKVREQAFVAAFVLVASVLLVLGLGWLFDARGLAAAFLLIELLQGSLCLRLCWQCCRGPLFNSVIRQFCLIGVLSALALILPNALPEAVRQPVCLIGALGAVILSFQSQLRSFGLWPASY
ncbi:hypothetical protein [Aquabacterium sp.]|uniref:hypothetical protein n=1 Tax=Aquabacterium sp. TaxID=1872578 RepID=UPI004037C53A